MPVLVTISPTGREQPAGYTAPYARWSAEDARQALSAAKNQTPGYAEAQRFVGGDHWQDGDGWVGPPERSNPMWPVAREKIAAQFTPRDAIGEVLSRVVNGVAKREAHIGTAPLGHFAEEEAAEAAAEALREASEEWLATLADWWDTVNFHQRLREAIRHARWSGRGYLRLAFPPSALRPVTPEERAAGGLPEGARRAPSGDFAAVLGRLRLTAPHPDDCVVVQDPDTDRMASVYRFRRDGEEMVELCWVEEDEEGNPGDTIIRLLSNRPATGARELDYEEYRWALGGRLPVLHMDAPVLITDVVMRQQKRLNFFETSLNRNVETAGFPERYITNAEPTGVLVRRAPGAPPGPYPSRTVEGVIYELHPTPRVLGAGVTTEVQGIKTKDRDGGESITTPTVHRFEPVDPDGTIRAIRHAYQTILEQCAQGHILIVGDATASGVSRQQAEGDFISDLADTQGPAEGLVRDTLEAATAIAELFSGDAERLDKMRITADLTLTPGLPTPEQQRVASELHTAGLLADEDAMGRVGVEDPSAMVAALRQEPGYLARLEAERGNALSALLAAGWPFEVAAELLGYDAETIARALRAHADLMPPALSQLGPDDDVDDEREREEDDDAT